jgi:geranylgeranyl reductase
MMFVGFVLTTAVVGQLLDPYSSSRLIAVAAGVAAFDVVLTVLVLWNLEKTAQPAGAIPSDNAPSLRRASFRSALTQVWREPAARQFTLFVFVSMLAYSGQELLLEPFVGRVYSLSPGQSARIASLQHGGALLGMILVAVLGSISDGRFRWWPGRLRTSSLRVWTVGGCLGSAIALAGLVIASLGLVPGWPIRVNMFLLGVANGMFAVAAIGSMMTLVNTGDPGRQGLRMGLWGAAQAVAFAVGGAVSAGAVDSAAWVIGSSPAAYGLVFALQAVMFVAAAGIAAAVGAVAVPAGWRSTEARREPVAGSELFDAIVIGGGPAGATAACDLARRGHRVALLDRAGRIKPCGGAIPPKLVEEFEIPSSLLVARVTGARMISPASKRVDMPIEGGYVGMVDREHFDEWLRERARHAGCVRLTGTFENLADEPDGTVTVRYKSGANSDMSGAPSRPRSGEALFGEIRGRLVIGADGAQSQVARQALPELSRPPFVAAYHEILRRPASGSADYQGARCDVYYQGRLSPDFYAWIFPHGETLSVGVGSAQKGFSLRRAVSELRAQTGLDATTLVRCEGAPIPLHPLKRWDNGRNVVVAGDAAGVVAPASGEGIYYAMLGGRLAAEAGDSFLETGDARVLRRARRKFMRAHGSVFFILGLMQRFWYTNDKRRERFVSICRDPDVQRLTWEAYMHKRLARSRPAAHVRIFFKDLMHLFGVARP